MGNAHKHDKDPSQHTTSSSDKEASTEGHKSDSDKNLDGKASNHAEAKKTASEPPKREPKNVTITDIELEKLKSEAAEFKDKYLRVLAESENARKRLQKEKQEMIQYALQNIIVDFLNPIDHMENALKYTQQMSEEVKHWAIGFQMILTQFKDVLTNNGVSPFDSEGKPFDPHFHEAVEAIVSRDFPPNTVIDESVKGYKMGDRIIRPARVKVSKAPPTGENEINKNEIIEQTEK
jgi:molecular chaperone GrpE